MTVTFTLCLVLISLFLTYLERSETLWSQSKLLTTKLRDHFSHSLVCLLWRISSSPLTSGCRCRSVNSSCAQPPSPLPPATLGHLPTLSVLGVGHLQILCAAQGPGIGQPQTFDTHSFLSAYNYTEDFTGKTSRLAHLSRTRKKLKRFVKACSRFYACISSLLIKPELHSEMGIYWQKSTFVGYWIKFLLILFEEHPFVFIKLLQTVNFTVHY